MSKYSAVPDPGVTLESALATVRALKDVVEQLAGLRGGQSLGAGSRYVQGYAPRPGPGVILALGDQWINPETNKLAWWNGKEWKQL